MPMLSHPPLRSAERLCAVLTLVAALVVSTAMIRVASEFGFTALGEPAVVAMPGR